MVVSLFNSFDIYSGGSIKPSIFFPFFIFTGFFFLISCRFIYTGLISVVKTPSNFKLVGLVIFTFVFFLGFYKLSGIVPYIYSFTSHVCFIFFYSFIFWFTLVISSVMYNPLIFFAGLSPAGSPLLLIKLLNLVEFASILIRPLMLSYRLAIKVTMGHIHFFLGFYFFSSIFTFSWFSLFLLGALLVCLFLEVCATLIQIFVYTFLLGVYCEEHS